MGARTSGREAALQILFAKEATGDDVGRAMKLFFQYFEAHPESREYAETAARGVSENVDALDEVVRAASTNWRLERMTRVDRNILRLGAWELRNATAPHPVIIDEAVELAKRFGSEESAAFVNGVLDRIAALVGAKKGLRGEAQGGSV